MSISFTPEREKVIWNIGWLTVLFNNQLVLIVHDTI